MVTETLQVKPRIIDPNEEIRWVDYIPTHKHIHIDDYDNLILDTSALFEHTSLNNIVKYVCSNKNVFTTEGVIEEIKNLDKFNRLNSFIKPQIELIINRLKQNNRIIDVKTSNNDTAALENIILSELNNTLSKTVAYNEFMKDFDYIFKNTYDLIRMPLFTKNEKLIPEVIGAIFNENSKSYMKIGEREIFVGNLKNRFSLLSNSTLGTIQDKIDQINKQNQGILHISYRTNEIGKHSYNNWEAVSRMQYKFMLTNVASMIAKGSTKFYISKRIKNQFENRVNVDRKVLLLAYAFPLAERKGKIAVYARDNDIRQLLELRKNITVNYENI